MLILIDGYNVLRHQFPGNSAPSERERTTFLRQIGAYRTAMGARIRDIMVVFDGGLFTYRTQESMQGVLVVHAGRGYDADSCIVSYVEQWRMRGEVVVITNDRGLRLRSHEAGGRSLQVDQFFALVSAVAETVGRAQAAPRAIVVEKYDFVSSDQELDELMFDASLVRIAPKDEEVAAQLRCSQKVAKKEREMHKLEKKLGK